VPPSLAGDSILLAQVGGGALLLTQKQPHKRMGLRLFSVSATGKSVAAVIPIPFPSDAIACCTSSHFSFSSVTCPVTVALYSYSNDFRAFLHWIIHQENLKYNPSGFHSGLLFWGFCVFSASAVSISGEK
jgi:hypothetical protein